MTMARPARNRQRKPSGSEMSPLEYMLAVMRDPAATPARRARMAIAALPYCHARMAEQQVGKKARQAEEAKRASAAWNGDLDLDGLRLRGDNQDERAASIRMRMRRG